MAIVGIRELKQSTSEVLRRVREDSETIEVSYRGAIVARIVPVARRPKATSRARAAWDAIDRVAEEISARWPRGVGAVRATREGRRG